MGDVPFRAQSLFPPCARAPTHTLQAGPKVPLTLMRAHIRTRRAPPFSDPHSPSGARAPMHSQPGWGGREGQPSLRRRALSLTSIHRSTARAHTHARHARAHLPPPSGLWLALKATKAFYFMLEPKEMSQVRRPRRLRREAESLPVRAQNTSQIFKAPSLLFRCRSRRQATLSGRRRRRRWTRLLGTVPRRLTIRRWLDALLPPDWKGGQN